MALLKRSWIAFLLLISISVYAEKYVIKKIEVIGLQRISLSTFYNYLPVKAGDKISTAQTSAIIRELYKTDFFSDIKLKRHGNTLLIYATERPVISSIRVLGNSKISKKELAEGLDRVGLVDGQVLNHAMLHAVITELKHRYYSLGLYAVVINTEIKPLKRSRVAVVVNIKEGPVATIKEIKIVGNKAFKERILRGEMTLTTTKIWNFFSDANKYSEEKLAFDLSKIRSYYLDRGYFDFAVLNENVKITPDKKHIYITINIREGSVYTLQGYELKGNLHGKRGEILKLITIEKGKVFSRKDIVAVQKSIVEFLSDHGYGNPNIRIEPIQNEKSHQIWLKIFIDVGKRIYVDRISFSGNTRTHDEVLRREMRQYEGELFSLSKAEESRRRLSVLGYLENVEYEILPVEDKSERVNLKYKMKEGSAVTAALQGGYSDADGFLYGASLKDNNVLGTGKMASIKFDNSKVTQYYGLGYSDPYFTANNISLSVDGYYQKDNLSKSREMSVYSTDLYGGMASFGIPLSDYSHITFGLGYEHLQVHPSSTTPQDYLDFLERNGTVFSQFKLASAWGYSNVDKMPFTTKGFSQHFGLDLYMPADKTGLQFYKVNYTTSWYLPLLKDFIFHTATNIGYGNSFTSSKDFPFFKNYFVGGIGTVRGFEASSIGRQDKDFRAMGGNFMMVGSASFIVPNPAQDKIRTSVFVDVGSVYNNTLKVSDLRSSYGVQVEWLTPLGAPLVLSFGLPLHKRSSDRLDAFQFNIGFSTQ